MGRRCQTCEHPQRAQIDLALARKVPVRQLEKRFGLSKDSLSRHKREHLSPQMQAALQVSTRPSDVDLEALRKTESENLIQDTVYRRARLYKLLDTAEEMGDLRAAASIHGRLNDNSEFSAKLLGEINTATQHITQNILVTQEYHDLRGALIRALRPFPDARAAITRVFQQTEAEAAPEPLEHAGT